jgi:hypothetical protein
MLIREQRRVTLSSSRMRRRASTRRRRCAAWLRVEPLEPRSLLNASAVNGSGGSPVVVDPNSTLDQAQLLGDLSTDPQASVAGAISNDSSGAGEVAWYSFTLDGPAQVAIDLQARGSTHPLAGVVSLYNDDQFDFQDLYDAVGYRMLVQATSNAGSDPTIDRALGPGTYFVAVSGAGNLEFHPLLAGSGMPGASGDFTLALSGTPLDIAPTDGPTVLTSDPAPGAVLDASPFVIRLDLSSALDPTTVVAGQTVSLTHNPDGTFGDGNDQNVPFAWTNVGVGGTELQLAPAAPLAPGYYQVTLAGDSSTEPSVVADLNGNPLGSNAANPLGQDYTETFQVAGIKGQTGPNAGSDDTPATAQNLGDITSAGLVRVAGAIGDDPYYNNSDAAHNPANDVDLYHLQISGPGRYAIVAAVFAGRIGSPLDPGVSLYGVDPSSGALDFIAGNNNTNDGTPATDGLFPLSFDSWLSEGLTAGDYYVAVADGSNTPSPSEFQPVGSPGLLDPNVSHSAQNGFTTGPYVLNLLVQPTSQPPQVIASYPAPGAVLTQPPSELSVQFDEPVNLQQQGYENFLAYGYSSVPSVYVEGADGTDYFPGIESYDLTTNDATFQMFDRLAPGTYTLHLSGALGLTDLGGNPLAGNDPSGDYLIHFSVKGTDPVQSDGSGQGGQITAQLGSTGVQNLGILFPDELQTGITLVAAAGAGASFTSAMSDGPTYQFSLTLDQTYLITLDGVNLPSGAHLSIQARTGKLWAQSRDSEATWFGEFLPGDYAVTVVGVPAGTPYQITFTMTGDANNPVPLVSGAGPALQLHFDAFAPPGGANGSVLVTGGGGVPSTPTSTPISGGPSTPIDGPTNGSTTTPGSVPSPSPSPTSTPSPSPSSDGNPSNPSSSSGEAVAGPITGGAGTNAIVTAAPGSGTPPPGTTLVVINVPALSPSSSPTSSGTAGLGPNETTGATGASSAAVVSASPLGVGAASQVASLISGNLALLGVGPIGGVQQANGSSGGVPSVQVALPSHGTSPVPMGLVSLVTLTRLGEFGDPPPPVQVSDRDVPVVFGKTLVEAPAAALAAAVRPALALRLGTEVFDTPAAPGAPPSETTVRDADVPTRTLARAMSSRVAVAWHPGQSGPVENGPDIGGPEFKSLAVASGPWLILAAVLGAVTLYVRKRRITARKATARRVEAAVPPPAGLWRRWGMRLPARNRLPHDVRAKSLTAVPAPRMKGTPRPRHMTNS